MDTATPVSIGTNVRRIRRWRDLSLEELAGLAGLSKGYLSKIENGHAAVEKRSTISSLAEALRVSVADLVGEFIPSNQHDTAAHAAIPDIRMALLSSSLDEAWRPAERPIAELSVATNKIATLRQACQYTEVGQALPGLLTELHAVAATGTCEDRTEALRSIVLACQVTALFVKNLGAVDLAWVAADRGHAAAVKLNDPVWIAASEFARTQALIGLGAYERADALSRRAAELIQNGSSEPELEVYGTSILTSAFCGATTEKTDPTEALREARSVARRTPGSNAFFLAFSPVNVDLWRISIALESDDPVLAAEIAGGVIVEQIPLLSRRSGFLIDHARALAGLRGQDTEVIDLLRQAERVAPIQTHANPFAREIVHEMVQRSRRDFGGRELRGLADRMGLLVL